MCADRRDRWKVSLAEAAGELAAAPMPFVTVFTRGDFSVELFAPRGIDTQQPHEFVAGDFLFVPAGMAHAFESFTEDFRTWVVFFGPNGGIGRSADEQHTQVPAVDSATDALWADARAAHPMSSASQDLPVCE